MDDREMEQLGLDMQALHARLGHPEIADKEAREIATKITHAMLKKYVLAGGR